MHQRTGDAQLDIPYGRNGTDPFHHAGQLVGRPRVEAGVGVDLQLAYRHADRFAHVLDTRSQAGSCCICWNQRATLAKPATGAPAYVADPKVPANEKSARVSVSPTT